MGACAVLALGAAFSSQAADAKVDGKWSWTMQGRGGGGGGGAAATARKMTLTLKTEGEKLTGTLTSPARTADAQPTETAIADGKVNGAEISFTVTREFNGNKFTSKYSGKVEGDTITGKTEMERNGETVSRDWKAERVVDKK